MKQPWKSVSDLIYDSDVTPEGIAFNYAAGNISYHVGHFILDEQLGDDAQLASAQVVLDVSDTLTLGTTFYTFSNMENNPLAGKSDNTTDEFELTEFFASYKIKSTPLPVSLFANYVENGAVDADNTAYMIGAETKQGAWSFAYNYRDIEINAIYDEWADSDFHNGGTGGDGHKYKVKYTLRDNLSLGATYFDTETEAGEEVNTLQVDLVAKF
jgi:hypothetical protein